MWNGNRIYLRQVEFSDLKTLLHWENNPENWEISDTQTPFSEEEMIDFIVEQTDFRASNQLRLMICLSENNIPIGAIDLFEIDETKKTAGVGILIDDKHYRRKGYASEALGLVKIISKELFSLNTLYCRIHTSNDASKSLFEKSGFQYIRTEKSQQINEYVLQITD